MALVHCRVGVRATGQTTTVPSDPVSRLQFYCHCISWLLPTLNIPSRLTAYKTAVLSRAEEDTLLEISGLIGPSTLGEKVIFRNDNMEKGNQFLELTHARTTVTAVRSVVIAGQQNRVAKIMMYTGNWMNRNYYSARREIANRRCTPRYTSTNDSSQSCVLL